ncbi:MAG: ABC-2 family transporter protein [Candidatus Peregrinibacteria bacterium]
MIRVLAATISVNLQQNLLHREFWIRLLIERLLPIAIPFLAWSSLFDYLNAEELNGWGRQEMAMYYLLIFFVSLFADIRFHNEMSTMVHTGTLNQWLIRPLSFMETALGFILAKMILLLIPGIAALLLGFWLMPGLFSILSAQALLTAVTVLPLSLVIFGLLSALIGMLSFWIIKTESIFALIMLTLEFLGGRLLPLSFLPQWLQSLSLMFPLRFSLSLPVEAILDPQKASLLSILLGQGVWCVLLSFLAVILWKKGIRHFDAVGG